MLNIRANMFPRNLPKPAPMKTEGANIPAGTLLVIDIRVKASLRRV